MPRQAGVPRRRQENTMGLAEVARGEPLPGGDRAWKRAFTSLRARVSSLPRFMCSSRSNTYIHAFIHDIVHAALFLFGHYTYFEQQQLVKYSPGAFAEIEERERERESFLVFRTLQYTRQGSLPSNCPLSSTPPCRMTVRISSFEVFRGFVLLDGVTHEVDRVRESIDL